MKKCKHCGKDIPEDAKTCPHCQKSVEEAPADKSIEAIKAAVRETVQSEIKPLKDSVDAIDKRVAAIEKMPSNRHTKVTPVTSEVYRGYKLFDQGERIREKFMTNPHRFRVLSDETKFAELQRFMIDVKFAMRGDYKAQQKLQDAAQKASDMGEDVSDALGGYAVPVEYEPDLLKLAVDQSFALQQCSILSMSVKQQKYPTELTRMGVTWEDEGGSIDAQNPTLGQVTLTAKKLAGLTSSISSELLADASFDIVGWLTEQFMYAIGLELDNQVLNGTGSPVSGVLTAAAGYSVIQTGANFSSISADDLSLMISKLAEEDASQAMFIYNRLIQHYIRTKKDTYGQYIWQRPSEGRPGTIWEIPYFQSSKATATTGASTAFVALGNWKRFYIGRRAGMSFAADPYTAFATDEIRFRAITRWGLSIARSTAFVRLITGA